MKGEIKIVILVKGEAGSIGVQSPDSDPVFVLVKVFPLSDDGRVAL